jgi:hypothetical protein
LLWGIDPWRWSGFLNLNSIGFGLPYPSMFATAVALLTGWALMRYARAGSLRWLVLLGLGFVVIVLSHPFTAVWTSVMLLALAVHCGLHRRDRVVPILVVAACAAVLVLAWPYYSLVELAFASDRYSDVHHALYERVPIRLVAALPGFVVVARRFRSDHTDPLALMLAGGAGIYVLGALSGDANLGRVLPSFCCLHTSGSGCSSPIGSIAGRDRRHRWSHGSRPLLQSESSASHRGSCESSLGHSSRPRSHAISTSSRSPDRTAHSRALFPTARSSFPRTGASHKSPRRTAIRS